MRPITRIAKIMLFCLGVLCIALGISLSTTAALGTSPISAIPYSLSLCSDAISFGAWVIIFNLFLVALEWLMLRKNIKPSNILIQVLLTFLFGYCVDMWMRMLTDATPQFYWAQVLMVLAGCLVIAFGVCLSIWSNVSVLPGDGFVLALSTLTRKDFGRMRMLSDITMSICGILICFALLGNMAGVREGTAIAAFATGYFVLLFMKTADYCKKITKKIS